MSPDFHISIVGAGLGGLCLAQGLRKAGMSFDVFERDPSAESRGQGYRIRIDADGQDALSANLPPELYGLFRQSCAITSSTGRFLDTELREIAGRPVETWRPSAVEAAHPAPAADLTANRQTLRQIMMCGIESRLRFGKTLRMVERHAGGVSCRFEDGTSVRSGLLVAGDGASSLVRRLALPGLQPRDTGDVNIYGKTVMTREAMQE